MSEIPHDATGVIGRLRAIAADLPDDVQTISDNSMRHRWAVLVAGVMEDAARTIEALQAENDALKAERETVGR